MLSYFKKLDSLGILLALCSVVPLVIGGYSLLHTTVIISRSERVTATVVSVRSRKPWPGKAVHAYPVVSFKDSSGATHQVELQSYTFPVSTELGGALPLLFDTSNPEEAIVDSWRARWAQPVLGVVFGFLLLGSAFFLGKKSTPSP